jgi:hypothetical protein
MSQMGHAQQSRDVRVESGLRVPGNIEHAGSLLIALHWS